MKPLERIELEVKSHKKALDNYLKDNTRDKDNMYKLVEESKQDNFSHEKWGLIYEHADRICIRNKQVRELRDLIYLKAGLVASSKTDTK